LIPFSPASGPRPAAIAACLLFAACAALAQPPSEGTIDLAGASRVRIAAFGRVSVEAAGDVSDIRYEWTGVPAIIAFRTSGSWRQLSVTRDTSSPPPGELRITLPASLAAIFVGSDQGSVTVSGLNGSLEVVTLAGNINVSSVKGPVSARTGGGEMTFSAIGGTLRSLSGGGSINVESAGAATLQTAGGDIIVGRVNGPLYAVTSGNIQVKDAASTVTANTAGGRIEIQRARGLVTAENGGGSIVVGSAPGVQAESAGGGILLKSISGPVRATTASGPVVASFARNATLATSFLSSGGGDVTVYLPSNTAVTVKAINETAGAGGGFVSDFPELSPRQPASGFGPAFAQGSLNGGGPLLMLSVSRGSIFVRKAR
jgi:hypothetical protein